MRAAPVALIVAWSGVVLADEADSPAPVKLEWVSICSSREDVLEDIGRLLHRAPGGRRDVDARVTIERRDGAAWRTRLVTRSGGAARERVFEAESCEAATEATVLMLAMAVNSEISAAVSVPSPNPPPPPSPPPSSPIPLESPSPEPAAVLSPQPVAVQSTSPPARALSGKGPQFLRQLSLTASLAVDAGTLPRLAAGGEAGIAWHHGRFTLEGAAANWVGQSASSGVAGAQFSLATVDVRVAYGWSFGSMTLAPLADAGIGFVGASGFGGTQSDFKANRALPALGGGGSVAWRIAGPLRVRLLGESLVLPSHPAFVVLNPSPSPSPTVHAPAAVVGRAMVGAELNF